MTKKCTTPRIYKNIHTVSFNDCGQYLLLPEDPKLQCHKNPIITYHYSYFIYFFLLVQNTCANVNLMHNNNNNSKILKQILYNYYVYTHILYTYSI